MVCALDRETCRSVQLKSNVTRLRHALPMSQDINKALTDLDVAIAKAVDAARVAGIPQRLIVAELHGHAHVQTHIMVS